MNTLSNSIFNILVLITLYTYVYSEPHKKSSIEGPYLPAHILDTLTKTKPPHYDRNEASTLACLPGFVLAETTCIQKISEKPFLACNGIPAVNGTCTILAPFIYICPDGYHLKQSSKGQEENPVCSKTVPTNIQYYCPEGFYDDGLYCAKKLESEVTAQCPFGELTGNQCIYREQKPYWIQAECPKDTILMKDGFCWKDVDTFDCTDDKTFDNNIAQTIASPKESLTALGQHVIVTKGIDNTNHQTKKTFRGLAPVDKKRPNDIKRENKTHQEMVAVTSPQQIQIDVTKKTCTKRIQVDAIAKVFCPEDYINTGYFCLKEIISPAINLCSNGNYRNGACEPAIRRIPKKVGCPKNAHQINQSCFIETFKDPISTCPENFEKIEEEKDRGCVGTLYSPTYECPLGMSLENDICTAEITRPALRLKAPLHDI